MSDPRPQAVANSPRPASAGLGEPLASRERWVRIRRWLLVLAVLVYAFAFQGTRPLYSPDEGRYTDVALNMLDSGDWLRPRLHPEVEHWAKPPLTYWSIAASFAAFGRTEFAARLPGALAFALTVFLMVPLGRRLVPAQPWLPALVYVTFAFPPLAANLVTTDTLLALFETLQGVAFVALWWASDARAARRARLLLGLAAGLAFMTKGPPGLLILASCAIFAFVEERGRGLARLFGWDMLLVFLAVGGSWYAIVTLSEPGVLRYFLVEEVVNRVASDKMHRNAEWYGALKIYVPTLLLGTLPWLPLLGYRTWRSRDGLATRVRAGAESRLVACWLLLPLVVFTLALSRLPLYLLPLFVPLALMTARALAPIAIGSRVARVLLVAWCIGIVTLRAVPVFVEAPSVDDRALAAALRAALPKAPDEAAFVDSEPRYGLRFYLGTNVRRLTLPGDDPKPQTIDLATEMRSSRGCRVLLVEPHNLGRLESALSADHAAYKRIGDIADLVAIADTAPACPAYAAMRD